MQVLLFGGYNRDLTGLTSQVRHAEQADEGLGRLRQSSSNSASSLQAQQSRELHEQLTRTLESNANLSRLFASLNSQFEDILTDQALGEMASYSEPRK